MDMKEDEKLLVSQSLENIPKNKRLCFGKNTDFNNLTAEEKEIFRPTTVPNEIAEQLLALQETDSYDPNVPLQLVRRLFERNLMKITDATLRELGAHKVLPTPDEITNHISNNFGAQCYNSKPNPLSSKYVLIINDELSIELKSTNGLQWDYMAIPYSLNKKYMPFQTTSKMEDILTYIFQCGLKLGEEKKIAQFREVFQIV